MREVLFIHSAGAQDETEGSGLFVKALRAALEPELALHAPIMPTPDAPDARAWLVALGRHVRERRSPFALVGHSLGGSIILKYLAENPILLRGVVSAAAPFWGAADWEIDEYALPPNAGAALAGVGRIVLYHSRDDDVVAVDHLDHYAKVLPKAVVRPVEGRGHLFGNGDVADFVADIRGVFDAATQAA